MNNLCNDNLKNLKDKICDMNFKEKMISKSRHVYRIHKENISDELENEFAKYIADELNNDKLYFDIERDLTLKFSERILKNIKTNIINVTKSNTVIFKPDLIIYKKEDNKNIILALIEFKNDLGFVRKIFGETSDVSIKNKDYNDTEYENVYKDKYKNKEKVEEYGKYKGNYFYGYKQNYIMKLINADKSVQIFSSNEGSSSDKLDFVIERPCYLYILACSGSNCSINNVKALYKYDFFRNEKPNYVKFNTFFRESIRLDDRINKGKQKEDVVFTLCDDEYGANTFIDNLKEDIKSKM